MSRYDFVSPIDRKGTYSLKWENTNNVAGKPDILPLWVADMDFPVLPEIQNALKKRVEHPVFGYMRLPTGYLDAVAKWHANRYRRSVSVTDLVAVPSVMHALSMAVRTFSSPGDRILVQPPVYNPFFRVVTLNDREIVEAPLVEPKTEGGRWGMDTQATRSRLQACRNEGRPVKLWLFCSPQNPTGRVWTEAELADVEALVEEFDLTLLSDEIHADLINPKLTFVSAYDRSNLARRSLIFTGPNKTFNLAGLSLAHVFIRDESKRSRFRRSVEADFFNEPNVLSVEAAWTAYNHGSEWLDELLDHVRDNHEYLMHRLAKWKPALSVCPWEGTYLAWVDARPFLAQRNYEDETRLCEAWEKEARVKITAGGGYRSGGRGWLRFNVACPRTILEEALQRIETFEKVL